jgi:hypothetical protein
MRRTMLTAASVAALACLGGCSSGDDAKQAAPTEQVTASAEPSTLDPNAWVDVPYKDYLAAADQIGLRPDVLQPESGFSSGLNTLCHTSAADLATMRKTQLANRDGTDTYTTAKYLGDEVGLRIGMSCPQRMGDWAATEADDDGASAGPTDDISEVSEADLARAAAQEASSDPDSSDDGASYPSSSPSSGSGGHVSSTGSGAVSTGNGTATH